MHTYKFNIGDYVMVRQGCDHDFAGWQGTITGIVIDGQGDTKDGVLYRVEADRRISGFEATFVAREGDLIGLRNAGM